MWAVGHLSPPALAYPLQHWPWHVHRHRLATLRLLHLFLAAFFVHFLTFHLSPHTTPGGFAGDGGGNGEGGGGEAALMIALIHVVN